jgi:predicted MFS family arabinose efflux permease
LLLLALGVAIPRVAPPTSLSYHRLLASVVSLIKREPVLRRRMVYGACGFAGFSLAWTTIVFLLAAPPFSFGAQAIGLFGLVGVAGALAARGFGDLGDRGIGNAGTGAVLAVILISWGFLAVARSSIAAVIVGLALLDFGVQGQNVLSQHIIYGLGEENASRVTTAYVTANFTGGAFGSAVGSLAWGTGGWGVVCAVGAGIALLAIGFWLCEGKMV